jgi:hypothetical protein
MLKKIESKKDPNQFLSETLKCARRIELLMKRERDHLSKIKKLHRSMEKATG